MFTNSSTSHSLFFLLSGQSRWKFSVPTPQDPSDRPRRHRQHFAADPGAGVLPHQTPCVVFPLGGQPTLWDIVEWTLRLWQNYVGECHCRRTGTAFLQGTFFLASLYYLQNLVSCSEDFILWLRALVFHSPSLLFFSHCCLSFLIQASGPELVGGTSGESEERIRQIFESAASNAPSVLFIDAIDVIAGKKDVRTKIIYVSFAFEMFLVSNVSSFFSLHVQSCCILLYVTVFAARHGAPHRRTAV